jgi:hypothetical protein
MLVRTTAQPNPTVQVVYLDQTLGTPFFVDLLGMAFMFNLEAEPEIVLQDDIARLGFELVSLESPIVSGAWAN